MEGICTVETSSLPRWQIPASAVVRLSSENESGVPIDSILDKRIIEMQSA